MEKDTFYIYDGPIMQFNTMVQDRWIGRTKAISKEKALSNLQFQYKMINRLSRNANIKLNARFLKKENQKGK